MPISNAMTVSSPECIWSRCEIEAPAPGSTGELAPPTKTQPAVGRIEGFSFTYRFRRDSMMRLDPITRVRPAYTACNIQSAADRVALQVEPDFRERREVDGEDPTPTQRGTSDRPLHLHSDDGPVMRRRIHGQVQIARQNHQSSSDRTLRPAKRLVRSEQVAFLKPCGNEVSRLLRVHGDHIPIPPATISIARPRSSTPSLSVRTSPTKPGAARMTVRPAGANPIGRFD